jgi:hypothetical protein
VAQALRRGERAVLLRNVGPASGLSLLPLLGLPEPARRQASQWLVGGVTPVAPAAARANLADNAQPIYTRFGGALILLPLLERMNISETTADWPAVEGVSAAALIRLLTLAKCAGAANALNLTLDPLLRGLLGVSPRLLPRPVSDWTARVGAAEWRTLQAAIAQSPLAAPARLVRIATRRGGLGVVLSTGDDHWLAAAPAPRVPSRRWLQQLGMAEAPPDAETDASAKVARDAEWLTLSPLLCRSRAADAALSTVARTLLRSAAARLPGFAGSSAPYLWRNFLDVRGRLLDDGEMRIVNLGRPPIHVVLSLSGLTRTRFSLPWLDERPFIIGEE